MPSMLSGCATASCPASGSQLDRIPLAVTVSIPRAAQACGTRRQPDTANRLASAWQHSLLTFALHSGIMSSLMALAQQPVSRLH